MPASPLGETRTLASIVRILVLRRDREFLKTPGSRKSHCTVLEGKLWLPGPMLPTLFRDALHSRLERSKKVDY